MNVKERYLAVYDDAKRKKLDRVPTFVQGIKENFMFKYQKEVLDNYDKTIFNNPHFGAPFVLGFDSVFAPYPTSYKSVKIKVQDANGKEIKINEQGQPVKRKTEYYEGGYVDSLEVLEKIQAKLKILDRSDQIQHVISYYEKLSTQIFPVLMVSGMFDVVWQAMGMNLFSRHFIKRTKLYKELVKFYADLAKINIEGLINATGNRGCIVNILDDVAFKGRPMISPARWEEDFLPYYKEITSIITDAEMIPQMHTDGNVTQMIPAFQKAGFQGLQGWEGGCDPYYINYNFPDFVVVGFGDVSEVLPFGSEDEIETHVKTLMDALKENRHFIIGPSTVIFEKIPLANVKIFMGAIKKYGVY